ncbi:hypothetical protein KC19_2G075800 [Ceratodon purpureus]|uniref:Uncharacterized protein n=1 Tax=Ceratodon purpureus TaxID=3225 RepID=A0A8T0ISV9_CERPU|nr:hypothetical protein KC19_2G075800 [Ceratodon purpureus]
MELLVKLYGELEVDVGKMEMQELVVEKDSKEYELARAVRRHLRTGVALGEYEEDYQVDEVEDLRKKIEAEVESLTRVTNRSRDTRNDIRLLEDEIITLERIMCVWVENPTGRARTLFRHLTSPDITEESAFQLAGLDCKCSDANCDFPFVIDDRHRHL